jgi:hypothetical protein
MHRVITQTALVLLLGAVPAIASTSKGLERLFVGQVLSVDSQANQVVVTSGDHSRMAFRFTDNTWVYGLSDGHHVSDLKPSDEVIVQYIDTEKGHTAYMLRHLDNNLPLAAADARVVRFDRKHREIVLDMPAGEAGPANPSEQTFRIWKRASIEDGQTVIRYRDLSLKPGDSVTVYYTTHNGTRTIDALEHPASAETGA